MNQELKDVLNNVAALTSKVNDLLTNSIYKIQEVGNHESTIILRMITDLNWIHENCLRLSDELKIFEDNDYVEEGFYLKWYDKKNESLLGEEKLDITPEEVHKLLDLVEDDEPIYIYDVTENMVDKLNAEHQIRFDKYKYLLAYQEVS